MRDPETLAPRLDRVRRMALALGAAAFALFVFLGMSDPTQFFRSYLLGYLYWVGIPLGSMAILMMHHLVGGGWGYIIRRPLEAAGRTIPAMAILFLPMFFGLPRLYLWAQPAAVAADPVLQAKQWYLSSHSFVIRAILYFVLWFVLAHFLSKWSTEQDQSGNPRLSKKLEGLSGPGLVIYGLTVTFMSIDWAMSLEPHWFSTIYGMLFMVVQALSAMAFLIMILAWLADTAPLASAATPSRFNDLGNLTLTFVMLWAYLSFSQFLIIWAGNLQREIPWYAVRATGHWAGIALFLIIFHFAVPFFLLLMRAVKRNVPYLGVIAITLLVVSLVDVFWLVTPAFNQDRPNPHWMDLLATFGIGGIWVAAYLTQLKARPLLPLHDPQYQEVTEGALGHGD
jgi:hypothetical protein